MDSIMKMIKAGLGIPSASNNVTPEYLLKMYYEGYNGALDDVKDIIDKLQKSYADTIREINSIYKSSLDEACNGIVKGVCNNIINNMHYKELPKK